MEKFSTVRKNKTKQNKTKKLEADCGTDHELLIAKFNLN